MQESSSETTVRRIGKYEVTGELGHGGMAVVYRARDTQLLRDVAIKILHPHLANDPESRQRFLREAQAAARLRHPNIVEVFDFSVETDRESFMVSELLEGPTLRRFAEQHPGMPAEVVAAVGVVLCDALECAHGQGVIHRDVKPDNVLLQKGGVLKLTDFGIAHVSDGGQMTVTGQVLGSPAHMAPEQIEGRSVDPRTDLFAVGTVLYLLAVGRLPFEAPHPHALLRKILETDYPDPLRVAPGIGHRMAGIIRKCLERDLEKRWQTAGELRTALAAFVADVGWDETAGPLRKYLGDAEGFAQTHRTELIAKLPELGVVARREGRAADALGYFNRALALEPGNARVLSLVRGIARKRQLRRSAGAVLVVFSAAAASALGVLAVAKWTHVRGTNTTRSARVVARPVVRPEVVVHRAVVAMPSVHADAGAVVVPEHAVVALEPRIATPNSGWPQVAAYRPALHPSVAVFNPRVGHPSGPANTAATPPLQRRVSWQLVPVGMSVMIDGERPAMGQGELPSQLPIGHHRFHLVLNDTACNDRNLWREVDVVGPSDGVHPQTIVLNLECTAGGTTPADSNTQAIAP